MTDFSVLLSVYYRENPDYLKLALDSVFSQTLLPTEVVLVEDGPLTENLEKIVEGYEKKYPYLKLVKLPVNGGLGNALREGLKHCSYSLVARMDTDDIAKPDRFKKQIAVFEQHPEMDVVGSWVDEFLTERGVDVALSQRRLPESIAELQKFAKRRNPVNHPTVMFRKETVMAAGSYQDFPLFEDWYLWIRMMANGANFYNIQESLLLFRISLDVYKRRGGWKYAVNEYLLRKEMLNMNFISTIDFILEVPLRFVVRVIPPVVRKYVYKYLLR